MTTTLILAILSCCFMQTPEVSRDVILQSKAASALNTVTLHPDSSFTAHSNTAYEEGELFEIIGETALEHEDADQNQKFKWYQVRTMDGEEGWVYGDGLAVALKDSAVEKKLQRWNKKIIKLDNGFEDALMWVAALQGRDNFHEQDFMNPIYNEFYIVLTNKLGRSVHINVAGENALGKSNLHALEFKDITGDAVPEIILQTNSYPIATTLENRMVDIYSTQAGTLVKIFEEQIDLLYEDDVKSPALFKHIRISEQLIRVEYIDYIACERYSQDFFYAAENEKMERCMEFVTYTYTWDKRKKRYELLYHETRLPVKGKCRVEGVYLRDRPTKSYIATHNYRLGRSDLVTVIKHFETINAQKEIELYLYVELESGERGYLPAKAITFPNSAHSALLVSYYHHPPFSKNDWNTKVSFLKIKKK